MASVKQRGVAFAKTTRPVIGSVIRRESLFARLDGTAGRTLAWISGPPGSGKSTLAASYIEARGLRSIWYQLDPDDADVATFFHYLGHAARRLDEGGSRELPAFTPQHHDEVASFSRTFFRQLFARAKGPAVLVLDNLHEVPANSPLHAAIDAGITQVPGRCCVMVVSRSEPPVSLARMQLGGGLVHVGWDDLRIGQKEIGEIANLRGQSLSPDVMAKLYERTQGWVAGLVLMLEHSKLSGRIAELPGDATPKVIFDYLAGEIFERFEPRMQQFLLRIASLPRMSVEIARALSGEDHAARLLINLAQNDYFVREVPGERERVYQFHPLLRDFLRDRAAHAQPAASNAPGLKIAATLLRDAGQAEDAVTLLAECQDWNEIARIATEEADAMLAQGRDETLRSWLDLIPAQQVESNPGLQFADAASRVHASPRSALRLYAQAYEGFRRAGDTAGAARSACGAVRAIVLDFDDLTALDHWIAELRALSGAGSDPGVAATLARAVLVRDPGSTQIDQWLSMAERASAELELPPDALTELKLGRAMAALFRGDLASATATAGALRSQKDGQAPEAAIAIAIAIASGLIHLLDGAHDTALNIVREGLATADRESLHAYDAWLRVIGVAAALGSGDRESARRELAALESAVTRPRRGDQAFVHYLRGWLASLEDDAATAARESKMALAVAEELGIPWLECLARVRRAQMLAGDGDHRGAEAQLRSAQAIVERANSPLLHAAVNLAAANAALKAGEADAARARLQAGLAQGREHGLRYIAGLQPQVLAELCATALHEGIEPEYARALVRGGKLAPPASALRLKQWPRPFQICLLGGFQLLRETAPVEFGGKGPGRPLELLKVLVAHGGSNVRSDQLADALWPRVDADYAHKSFTATLHRLRRILDEDDALILRDARLSLNPRLCWVDTWALEQILTELDAALRDAPAGPIGPELRKLAEAALAHYRGPFLPDESEQPSFIAFRDQIRGKLLRCLSRVARRWEETGLADAAVDCYLRCIDADELGEAFYRNLMLCYQRRGEQAEAIATYERLRSVLSARTKGMPSQETQSIYAGLIAQQSGRAPAGG